MKAVPAATTTRRNFFFLFFSLPNSLSSADSYSGLIPLHLISLWLLRRRQWRLRPPSSFSPSSSSSVASQDSPADIPDIAERRRRRRS
jgi:hypothetical protein